MNILNCFGSGESSSSSGAGRGRGGRPPKFDPSKGARIVKLGVFSPAPPLGSPSLTRRKSLSATPLGASRLKPKEADVRSRSISPELKRELSRANSPPPAPSLTQEDHSRAKEEPNWRHGQISREEISSQEQERSKYSGEDMKRPTAGASGGARGHADDPYACTHLTELMHVQPIESTYRAESGGQLPEGIEAPTWEQNMRRLYVHDEDRVLLKVVHYGNPTSVGIEFEEGGEWQFKPLWTQRAGPRAQIYFNPSQVKAAIVTCGGLCPGLNDVIRQVVLTLDLYGVKEILGIQYGFKGFVDPKYPPVAVISLSLFFLGEKFHTEGHRWLNRKLVSRVHMAGGSFLGVSRGTPDLNDIVDRLQNWGVNFFFVIGGNGSHAGAHEIYKKCMERKMKIAVVGIPKTIDNDLQLMDKTFGFDTSVEEAQRAINAAFVEASSAYNGIGIVKLMGRQSGFIAMYATLASGQVDIVLIPEVPFILEGEDGVYNFMKKRLDKNGLCVVVIAEGAGQDLLESAGGVDDSGNPILGDIGKWFYSQVKTYFSKIKMSVDVKYIDPTYMIRARPCNSSDHIFCSILGQNAVHGAFAGYTDITIGLVNTHYVFLPIPKVIETARKVDPNSNMWHRTVSATGQPDFPARPEKIAEKKRASSRPTSPVLPISEPLSPRSQPFSPVSQYSGPSRSQSPRGESQHSGDESRPSEGGSRPRRRVSQLSIRIDKNNVNIKSVENVFSKKK
ncbi:hypothetical protein R1flu_021138 [Riccia fluitans]|uniref:Phosphofructokinase domain-containing protein n=1 Tax=Riccia fluitans TaxID=41844 RepID=A0ABD1ZNH6_9MARC